MSHLMSNLKLSKWQWALIVGTPLAIYAGYCVIKKPSPATDKKKTNQEKLSTSNASIDEKSVSEENKFSEIDESVPVALKFKNEGNLCYRNGKFDEAIAFYDKGIAACPPENRIDLSILYQNRAAAHEMLKKWSAVKADCTKAIECNPRHIKAYFRRAKAHEATKNMMDCLDDITATCILEMFQNNQTIVYADRILKQIGRDLATQAMKERVPTLPSEFFLDTYFRAFVHDPIKSMSLPEADVQEPLRGFARAKKALEERKYDEIMPACTEEIESSEAEAQYKTEALLLRGTFNVLCGNFPQALQDLNAVAENENAEKMLRSLALIRIASTHVQSENKEKGFEAFEKAEKLTPDNADVYHQRAQIYILLEELHKALEEFEKVERLAPKHAPALVQKNYVTYRMAILNEDQFQMNQAMSNFSQLVKDFPNCVECFSIMAQVLGDQQQFNKSNEFYEKAMKMAPNNANILVHQAVMWLQWKGDIEKAVGLIEKALEIDPKCELACETLGTVEVQRTNMNRAIDLFDRAIKLAKNQQEMTHLFSLRCAAVAQLNVTQRFGIDISTLQGNLDPTMA